MAIPVDQVDQILTCGKRKLAEYIQENTHGVDPLFFRIERQEHTFSISYEVARPFQEIIDFWKCVVSLMHPTLREFVIKTDSDFHENRAHFLTITQDVLMAESSLVFFRFCQSGKTNLMISYALLAISYGYSTVIVVTNGTDQVAQCDVSIENYIKKHPILAAYGVPIMVSTQKNFAVCNAPAIYVCIGNVSKLNILSKLPKKSYVICTDEGDSQSAGKSNRASLLTKMITESLVTVNVTGTVMDLLGNEKLRVKDVIYILPDHDKYVGLYDFLFNKELPENTQYSGAISDDILQKDYTLAEDLKELSMRPPASFLKDSEEVFRPNIMLVNNCGRIEPQKRLQEWIRKEIPSLTTLVYNGTGVFLSVRGGIVEHIKKASLKSKDAILKTVIQRLKDNYSVLTIPNIVILSGMIVKRGLSIASVDHKWEITIERLVLAPNCSQPDMIQKAMRLAGNKTSKSIPREFQCTAQTRNEIMNAFHFIEESLNTLRKHDGNALCKDILEKTPVFEEKNLKNHSVTVQKKKIDINFVQEPCGWPMSVAHGMELPDDEYWTSIGMNPPTNETRQTFVQKQTTELEENVKKRRVSSSVPAQEAAPQQEQEEVVISEEDKKEFQRLRLAFKRWANGDSKIAYFMRALDPERVYTEQEMKHLCEEKSIVNMIQLTTTRKDKSNGWGKILKHQNETYMLYPELVQAFRKSF